MSFPLIRAIGPYPPRRAIHRNPGPKPFGPGLRAPGHPGTAAGLAEPVIEADFICVNLRLSRRSEAEVDLSSVQVFLLGLLRVHSCPFAVPVSLVNFHTLRKAETNPSRAASHG
jgi:hypothetical protein